MRIPCLWGLYGNVTIGFEDTCDYETPIECEECVCRGGRINPKTGKRMFWLRWFLFYEMDAWHYQYPHGPGYEWSRRMRYKLIRTLARIQRGGKRR